MTTELLPVYDGRFLFDNTNLCLMQECHRKAFNAVIKRRTLSKPADALIFGGHIHEALAIRYRSPDRLVSSATEDAMFSVLEKHFAERPVSPDDYRNLDYAIETITLYNKHYQFESFEVLHANGHPLVEIPFVLPFGTMPLAQPVEVYDLLTHKQYTIADKLPIYFTGRIDIICKNDYGTFVLDHKTSSIGGGTFFSEFYTGTQLRGYIWAARQLFPDINAKAAMVNALFCRRPTRTGKSHEFARDQIHYSDDALNDWFPQAAHHVTAFLSAFFSDNIIPSTTSCVTKYGLCPYYDVCTLPKASQDTMLQSGNYTDITWDPIMQEQNAVKQKLNLPGV